MSARDELERLYGNKGKKKPGKGIASTVAGVASGAVSAAENIVARTTGNSSRKTARQKLDEMYGSPDAPGAVRKRSAREGMEKYRADKSRNVHRDTVADKLGLRVERREPNEDWQEDWLEEFGVRYNSDPESAYSFATEVNDYLAAGKLAEKENRIKKNAARNPVPATIASLLTAPFGLVDTLDKGLTYVAAGELPQRDKVTLGSLSRTMTSGVAESLNEKHGTFDEGVPIVGGKGWGDAYSLGNSALQSMVLGNTIGSVGTLATFFGQSASSGMAEIKARGGSDGQAILYGLTSGAVEVLAEKLPLDNLLKGDDAVHYTLKSWLGNTLKQAGMEGTEELVTSVANEMADRWIMGDKSNFNVRVQEYMARGMNEEQAKKKAWADFANDVAFDFFGGAASGAGSMAVQTGPATAIANYQTRRAYTPEMDAQLLELAMATEEDSKPYKMAQKLQGQEKGMTGGQINDLTAVYEQYTQQQRIEALTEDARQRLEELDAEEDKVVQAIVKSLTGEKLTRSEQRALERSAEGRKVLQDMQQEPATQELHEAAGPRRSKAPTIQDRQQIDQEPLDTEESAVQEEKDPLLETLEQEEARETASESQGAAADAALTADAEVHAETDEESSDNDTDDIEYPDLYAPAERAKKWWKKSRTRQAKNFDGNANTDTILGDIIHRVRTEIAADTEQGEPADDRNEEAVPETAQSSGSSRTLEEATAGFGNQAGAVRKLYEDGQDVDVFEAGVRAAWELGNSGIPMERAVSSLRTQGITESQRRQAYLLGQGAARLAAQGKAAANAKAATGGTVRRRGAVKGQDVSIQDLSKTFNDPQKSAYKLLSFYAEVTGVDVVLYKGKQEQETGRFAHGENTIYIDIDAGTNGWDATDLGAYTMMRTFSHEFTHFVEKWNPTAYNELREAVFAEMEKNGSDPEVRVEIAMQEQGLSFDQASREVVAEALTDILPESQFVQALASKHKGLFDKLKERLEAFVTELKAHWKKLTGNNSREAVALKRQVGDALEYADEIVQLFDRVAGEAVEAYQATVMGEEVPADIETTDAAPETNADPMADAVDEDWSKLGEELPEPLLKYMKKFGNKHPMSILTVRAKGGDKVFAGSGYLLFRIDNRLENWTGFARFRPQFQAEAQFESFGGKGKPLTEQPMIGNNGKTRVAEFDTPDGKIFCNYDLLRYLDGNTLTYKKLGDGSAIQAADPATGELVGVLMGMKVDEKNITDKKPGKMKSFGKAAQPKTQDAETPKQEPQTITDDRFAIESTKGGTVYVTFPGKPDAAVRDALKARGFKWAAKKKAWYAKDDPGAVADALREVYEAADTPKAKESVEPAPKQRPEAAENIPAKEPDFDADPYGWLSYQLMQHDEFDLGTHLVTMKHLSYGQFDGYQGFVEKLENAGANRVPTGEVYRTNKCTSREDAVEDIVRVLKKLQVIENAKAQAQEKKATPEAKEMEGNTPSEKLANAILTEYLSRDRVIDSMKLYALADRAFGGTQGEGAYNRKDAYDALELAVNKYLLDFAKDMNGDILKAQQSVWKLEELLRFLPTQTVRTQEQQDFQQFSTPPNIAYLAAWAGNVQPGEMVLEPSAGIGGIAAFAKSWGAEVAVN